MIGSWCSSTNFNLYATDIQTTGKYLFNNSICSWWYNYLPVPEAEYYNKWWCMCENDDGETHHRPEGEERGLCFPSDPAVQFVAMIRDGEILTQDNQTLHGIEIPPQYQVRPTMNHSTVRSYPTLFLDGSLFFKGC